MKAFAALYNTLDSSTSTAHKVQAMADYFAKAKPADAAWAAYFLSGGKPRRTVPTRSLRAVALQASGLPDWLFEESYQAVGDLAETMAHVVPPAAHSHTDGLGSRIKAGLAEWMERIILPLRDLDDTERVTAFLQAWLPLPPTERFLLVKLVGGGFRVGVSRLLVTRALAQVSGVDARRIAARMMGYTDAKRQPTASAFSALVAPDEDAHLPRAPGQPFPFFLAHPFQDEVHTLGPVEDWLVEWKYDGIRAQAVCDGDTVCLWSRGEELINDQFPELVEALRGLPEGTVLDGEILVWAGQGPAPFQALQARLNRKSVTRKLMQESPVVFMAYDLLALRGQTLLDTPQWPRRQSLQEPGLLNHPLLRCSPLVSSPAHPAHSWDALAQLRAQSRERGVEGFMLKHAQSRYGAGRTKADGLWWKWKIDPMQVDCVLVYAQRGHGRRASLYTDYTFAVWDRSPQTPEEAQAVAQAIAKGEAVADTTARGLPRLVPFAKAYSGLTDEEFKRVDREIRKHTVDKFGPVRTVVPTLVFELGFEGISLSGRHKSGVAVRFPRMLRIRDDKALHQADTLATLKALLPGNAPSVSTEDME